MAHTQQIHCRSCGHHLAVLDCDSGDYKGATTKAYKVLDTDDGKWKNKDEIKVKKKVLGNLDEAKTIVCGKCGTSNKV